MHRPVDPLQAFQEPQMGLAFLLRPLALGNVAQGAQGGEELATGGKARHGRPIQVHHAPRFRAPAHFVFPCLALHHVCEHGPDPGLILREHEVVHDIHVA